MYWDLKRGFLTELFFKNNINPASVFDHHDSCTQKHIHKLLALRSMYIMFRDLWGEWKRLRVEAVTLAGHLSMARWARRRRLRATPGVSTMVSVLFLTHRNAEPGRVWHCFGLRSAGRWRIFLRAYNLRMAPSSNKSPCSSVRLRPCWGVWMSSLISMQSESRARTGYGGAEGGLWSDCGANCSSLWCLQGCCRIWEIPADPEQGCECTSMTFWPWGEKKKWRKGV